MANLSKRQDNKATSYPVTFNGKTYSDLLIYKNKSRNFVLYSSAQGILSDIVTENATKINEAIIEYSKAINVNESETTSASGLLQTYYKNVVEDEVKAGLEK